MQARDTGFLERLLADEFTLTMDGGRQQRDEYIAGPHEGEEWEFERMDVRVYGDAALVRSVYRQPRRDATYLMSDVFVRRASGWLVAARHVSAAGA